LLPLLFLFCWPSAAKLQALLSIPCRTTVSHRLPHTLLLLQVEYSKLQALYEDLKAAKIDEEVQQLLEQQNRHVTEHGHKAAQLVEHYKAEVGAGCGSTRVHVYMRVCVLWAGGMPGDAVGIVLPPEGGCHQVLHPASLMDAWSFNPHNACTINICHWGSGGAAGGHRCGAGRRRPGGAVPPAAGRPNDLPAGGRAGRSGLG
jgi:hypothetical protein